MPTKAIMFGDNTVRELKNQFCMDYMAHMVAKRKMRLFASYFLRKSHTHDKIYQLWGVVARRIANCDSTLRAERHPQDCPAGAKSPCVRAWLGSTTELHVQKLDACREWKNFWKPVGVTLSGGLLEDVSSNHVFS